MGQPDLFAKRTFAEETERLTGGAITWQDPPEIRIEKVQSDGLLLIHRPDLLEHLTAPWPEALRHEEVMVELKLAGDHVDRRAIERALLRRQARQLQRVEEPERAPSWLGHEPLWMVAPHVPEWLGRVYAPVPFAPGCYRVEPLGHCLLWVAANELPLRDELIAFLVARSGRALDEFGRWVAGRRPIEWVLAMLEYLAMSATTREELLWQFGKAEDPEVEARRQRILEVLLEASPQVQERLIEKGIERGIEKGIERGIEKGISKGRLAEARAALRRVLARRQIELGPGDDARIEACIDLATLERWHDQSITAASVSEALQ
ncbi:hypothetical protein WMF04_20365 [Sorangium sp. So ce260]|uniref:hypothetical protein n=1 Tax=Sorangium sp. So ce260 TaxID=3133291 RepID=UPI003F648961